MKFRKLNETGYNADNTTDSPPYYDGSTKYEPLTP